MTSALIGHTGYVGGSIARQYFFDHVFNSKTIDSIAGRAFDLLVVSAMPAAKWVANANPDADRAGLDRLWTSLGRVEAAKVVLISTVDVYPNPRGVDEETSIEATHLTAYGAHRLMLEQRARSHFSSLLTLRLAALFGYGLKKNAVFDLLHGNDLHKIHAGGVFQFYNLDYLWADIQTALTAGLTLVNLATEPVSIREVAREAFGQEFTNETLTAPVRYDFRSRHASIFGGRNGYLYSREQVLADLTAFVEAERNRGKAAP